MESARMCSTEDKTYSAKFALIAIKMVKAFKSFYKCSAKSEKFGKLASIHNLALAETWTGFYLAHTHFLCMYQAKDTSNSKKKNNKIDVRQYYGDSNITLEGILLSVGQQVKSLLQAKLQSAFVWFYF